MPIVQNESSRITKRYNNKTISEGYLTRLERAYKNGYGTPSGVYDNSIMNNIQEGNMTSYKKCEGSYEVDRGCPCIMNVTSQGPTPPPPQPVLPTVTTTAITDITDTTAVSGGNVTSDGGATVTARGIVWSIIPLPTLSDSFTTDGTGTGVFISNMSGLTQNTQYYVRAYATNSVGTSYGNQVTFTTSPTPPPQVRGWATYVGVSGGTTVGYAVANGSVYMVGSFISTINFYDASGIILNDPSGNQPTTVKTTLSPSSSTDAFIAKYDTSGILQWVNKIGNIGIQNNFSVITDSIGNIYVCGDNTGNSLQFYDASGISAPVAATSTISNAGMFIAKYDSNGKLLTFTRSSSGGSARSLTMKNDILYVTGNYAFSSLDLYDASGVSNPTAAVLTLPTASIWSFIASYDTSLKLNWATYISTANSNRGFSITADSSNNVYVCGDYQTLSATGNIYDASGRSLPSTVGLTLPINSTTNGYVIKYNSSGKAQWRTRVISTIGDQLQGIYTYDGSSIYVTGFFNNSTDIYNSNDVISLTLSSASSPNRDVCIVKYDTNGNVLWGNKITTASSNLFDEGVFITGNSTNIYISGYINNSAEFFDASGSDPTNIVNTLTTTKQNIFLAKYTTSGVLVWPTQIGGGFDTGSSNTSPVGYGISLDGNDVYLTGRITGTTNIYQANGRISTPNNPINFIFGYNNQQAILVKYNSDGLIYT